jgi:hypothetical protein
MKRPSHRVKPSPSPPPKPPPSSSCFNSDMKPLHQNSSQREGMCMCLVLLSLWGLEVLTRIVKQEKVTRKKAIGLGVRFRVIFRIRIRVTG